MSCAHLRGVQKVFAKEALLSSQTPPSPPCGDNGLTSLPQHLGVTLLAARIAFSPGKCASTDNLLVCDLEREIRG